VLDLQKLKTFQAVAETSSFTKAAVELGCSQSSVTAHIQALEKELGAPLFDRTSKRISLTGAGRQTLKYAGRILALASEAKAAVHSEGKLSGSLSVSAPEVLVAYRLPEVLRKFQGLYPQVHLTLATYADPNARIDALLRAELDLAFAVGQTAHSGRLTAKFLASEEIVVVAAPDYGGGVSGELTAQAIAEEQILVTDKSCSFRQLFELVLSAARIQLKNTLELASIEAIKQCALAGMGLAVVPKMAVATELLHRRLVALPWPEAGVRAQIQILRRRERLPSAEIHAFWSLAERAFAKDLKAS